MSVVRNRFDCARLLVRQLRSGKGSFTCMVVLPWQPEGGYGALLSSHLISSRCMDRVVGVRSCGAISHGQGLFASCHASCMGVPVREYSHDHQFGLDIRLCIGPAVAVATWSESRSWWWDDLPRLGLGSTFHEGQQPCLAGGH